MEVATLSRQALEDALEAMPSAAKHIRQAAMYEAIGKVSALIVRSSQQQAKKAKLANASAEERERMAARDKMANVFGGGDGGSGGDEEGVEGIEGIEGLVSIAQESGEDILKRLSAVGGLPPWREPDDPSLTGQGEPMHRMGGFDASREPGTERSHDGTRRQRSSPRASLLADLPAWAQPPKQAPLLSSSSSSRKTMPPSRTLPPQNKPTHETLGTLEA